MLPTTLCLFPYLLPTTHWQTGERGGREGPFEPGVLTCKKVYQSWSQSLNGKKSWHTEFRVPSSKTCLVVEFSTRLSLEAVFCLNLGGIKRFYSWDWIIFFEDYLFQPAQASLGNNSNRPPGPTRVRWPTWVPSYCDHRIAFVNYNKKVMMALKNRWLLWRNNW